MKFKDIILCGIQDLKAQRKKNVISFVLIFLSISVYIGVNSTISGIQNGSYDTINGHATRILYMMGEGDASEEYEYLVNKYGDDERVQEIYVGAAYVSGMTWYGVRDFLGVNSYDMWFSSCYESVFNYDYKGEKRIPKYNEIILPRYMYDIGVYDEYSYANGDELIGKTFVFKNESYRWEESEKEELEEYKLTVIGTYDNVTKKYDQNAIFANPQFVIDMGAVYRERMYEYHQKMGAEWMTEEIAAQDLAVYMFIKEGYNINEVYNEMDAEICDDLDVNEGDNILEKLNYMDSEVESFYYYIIAMGNIISFVLLCIAIINILISSINEVRDRQWEFALKIAMGYRKGDIVKIFAVEKIVNVIKSLGVSLITLLLYTKALTYYNQNMVEYWKRSWIITIDIRDVVISLIIVVIAALMGVVIARLSIGSIEVSKTLKAGE